MSGYGRQILIFSTIAIVIAIGVGFSIIYISPHAGTTTASYSSVYAWCGAQAQNYPQSASAASTFHYSTVSNSSLKQSLALFAPSPNDSIEITHASISTSGQGSPSPSLSYSYSYRMSSSLVELNCLRVLVNGVDQGYPFTQTGIPIGTNTNWTGTGGGSIEGLKITQGATYNLTLVALFSDWTYAETLTLVTAM